MVAKRKRERFIIVWQDEYGNKNWAVAKSKKEADDVFYIDDLPDGTAIAIQYKARITGTSFRPAAFRRMKTRPGGIDWSIDTFEKFKALLEQVWNTHYGHIQITRKYIHISTGGWSENEEALPLIRRTAYWFTCWVREQRGGHYTLEIRKTKVGGK